MNKSLMLPLFATILISSLLLASGETTKESSVNSSDKEITARMVIDDFDDGNVSTSPEWWVFDKVLLSFDEVKGYGESTLFVKGKTNNWYVGGIGTYLAKSASEYNTLCISIFGQGEGSGKIKIQLYDDDNNTTQLEQDEKWEPIADDRFEYEIDVNWLGWKDLRLPISSFKDTNNGIGDDKYNPGIENGSGGLLHFQMIFNTALQSGKIDMKVDNIKLIQLNK